MLPLIFVPDTFVNAIENFDKAVDYLQEKFNWDEEDATVVYFYDIIKPKF